ncbi:MAG: hypothetical protein ACFBQW_06115 [Sphingomonadaceae bacterium]
MARRPAPAAGDGDRDGYVERPVADSAHHATARPALLKRISWGAIFAGAVIALGVLALLSLLGTAIGLAAVDPAQGQPFAGVGIGTAIWWIATSVIALAIGGYVAGHTSGIPERSSSTAHGAAVWGLVTIVTLWFATSAIGTTVNTAASAVSTVARTTVNVAGSVGGAVIPDDVDLGQLSPAARQARQEIRAEAERLAQQAGLTEADAAAAREEAAAAAEDIVRTPGDARQDVNQLIDELFAGPDPVVSEAERERLAEAVAARFGTTPEEAERIAARWQNQAAEATRQAETSVDETVSNVREQAGEAGEAALDTLSKLAWYAFFASLLSLAGAVIAAGMGAPRRPYLTD